MQRLFDETFYLFSNYTNECPKIEEKASSKHTALKARKKKEKEEEKIKIKENCETFRITFTMIVDRILHS